MVWYIFYRDEIEIWKYSNARGKRILLRGKGENIILLTIRVIDDSKRGSFPVIRKTRKIQR